MSVIFTTAEISAGAPYNPQYEITLPSGFVVSTVRAVFIDSNSSRAVAEIGPAVTLSLLAGTTYQAAWPATTTAMFLNDPDDANSRVKYSKGIFIQLAISGTDAQNNPAVIVATSNQITVGSYVLKD
jgi:hypothetical protein